MLERFAIHNRNITVIFSIYNQSADPISTTVHVGIITDACNSLGNRMMLRLSSVFKALLFLAAGGVLHSMADQQDLRRLGGLVGLLPFTYTAILVGSLSLMAFP